MVRYEHGIVKITKVLRPWADALSSLPKTALIVPAMFPENNEISFLPSGNEVIPTFILRFLPAECPRTLLT